MAIFTANITSALTALSLQQELSSLVGLKVGLCNMPTRNLISVLPFFFVYNNVAREPIVRTQSARSRSYQISVV